MMIMTRIVVIVIVIAVKVAFTSEVEEKEDRLRHDKP